MSRIVKRAAVYSDLETIALYIAPENPKAALRSLDCAEETFNALAATPGEVGGDTSSKSSQAKRFTPGAYETSKSISSFISH